MSTKGAAQSRDGATAKQSRASWLEAALRALASGGIDKVSVEALARELGVTKGSFYWHFKDRPAFLHELLDYWAAQTTQTVIENRSYPADPVERIRAVADDIVRRDLAGLDPHIRAWTQYDAEGRNIVARVDKRRFAFLRSLFSDAGFAPDEAALRARLLYHYAVGEQFNFAKESPGKRRQRMRAQADLLLRR